MTEVRKQLDAKMASSQRPGPMQSRITLLPTPQEIYAIKVAKMLEETQSKMRELSRAGLRSTVVVEAEMD